MYKGIYKNIALYFIVGSILSILIVYFSKFITINNDLVKTISRGTMFIVGTHLIITNLVKVYFPNLNVLYSIFGAFVTIQ